MPLRAVANSLVLLDQGVVTVAVMGSVGEMVTVLVITALGAGKVGATGAPGGEAAAASAAVLGAPPSIQRRKSSMISGGSARVGGIGPPASISSRLIMRYRLLFKSPAMTLGA